MITISKLSRRDALRVAGAAAAALAASAVPALAQSGLPNCSAVIPQKASKKDAQWVEIKHSLRRCESCRFFQNPDRCVVVDGAVAHNSGCALWASVNGSLGCAPDETIKL